MRVAYIADMRFPTEKAHGLQIAENCAAMAEAGAEVTLVVPRRVNTPVLRRVDAWSYYSMPRTFTLVPLPCIDLFALGRWFEPVAARLESLTFALAALVWALGQGDTVFYSRNELPLALLSFVLPARRLAYEAHQRRSAGMGRSLQRRCASASGTVVAVTTALARHLGAPPAVVLRDGFRAARFESAPGRAEARRRLGLPADAIIVGYVGRLATMGMPKGVGELLHACARLRDARAHLVVVGGPAASAEALASEWSAAELDVTRLHLAGDVPAADVPAWLAAFDVCAMPLPWTPHFAHDASPLKLFEYMAAGRAVLATRLPSVEEVVTHGLDAWLVTPDDPDALADGLRTLLDDASLRDRLGQNAGRRVAEFSWDKRARTILTLLNEATVSVPRGASSPRR
jgi:glycosyltransferase involved in cell wall biosynthesis